MSLDGKVALVTGSLVMANLNERIAGVKEVFAEKYPDIEIVDTIATDDDFAKGLDVCEAMLRAYPVRWPCPRCWPIRPSPTARG